MKPGHWNKLACISVLGAACLGASPLAAQQDGGEEPRPAEQAYPPVFHTSGNQQNTDQQPTIQPDNGPVSGVQNLTLGTREMRHSYWVPGIRYTNAAQSHSLNSAGNSGWITSSYASGDLSTLEAWSDSLLSVNYSGGGFSSTDPLQGSGQYHQLAAAYEIDLRRWQALFVDQFSYLPQSAFGFGGASGLALQGITGALSVPLAGLQNVFVPGQTFLSEIGSRYSNAGAAQLTYELNRRSSITVAGVHGLLRFVNPASIDGDTEILNAGYNYVSGRNNSEGLVYIFSAYHFPGSPQALGDHVVQLVYARKITGQLAIRLAGGPEVTTFRIPISGTRQRVSGTGNASLVHALRRGSVTLGYSHGTSGGSGVFTGSSADLVSATWNRQLTRVWNWSLNFGYAKNKPIVGVTGLALPSYESWQAGAGLSRPLGRTANLSLAYQAQRQSANAALCNGLNCRPNYTWHEVFLSFQWHTRPLVLR